MKEHHITIDLDDPEMVRATETHGGHTLARVLLKRGNHQQVVFVSLRASGFEANDRKGWLFQLESPRAGQMPREESINVSPKRDGFEQEKEKP